MQKLIITSWRMMPWLIDPVFVIHCVQGDFFILILKLPTFYLKQMNGNNSQI